MNKLRIGDLIKRHKELIKVEDGMAYKQVTIRTKHKGVVLRGTQQGSAIGTKNQYVARQGQFILSRIDARNGAFGMVPAELEGAIITNDFWCFDINEEQVLREFFYTLIQAPDFDEACKRASIGTTNRQRINENFFLNYELEIPPLAEQKEAIRQIDGARQHLDRIEAELAHQTILLIRMRKSILREAVQGGLTSQDHLNETATELLARIRSDRQMLINKKEIRADKPLLPLSKAEMPYELPQGWIWCRLGEVMNISSGVAKGKSYQEIVIDTPYLAVANVQRGYLQLNHVKKIAVPVHEVEKYALQKGDLLMTEGGDADKLGRCAIWNNEIDNCIHQNHIFRVRIIADTILPYYAMSYINSDFARAYFLGAAKQTTNLASINLTQLKNTPFPLPPLPEQQRIVAKVTELLDHCTELEGEVDQARQSVQALRAAALHEAFRISSTQFV